MEGGAPPRVPGLCHLQDSDLLLQLQLRCAVTSLEPSPNDNPRLQSSRAVSLRVHRPRVTRTPRRSHLLAALHGRRQICTVVPHPSGTHRSSDQRGFGAARGWPRGMAIIPSFLSSVAGMAGRQAVTWDLCALRAADANAQLSMGRGEHLEESIYQMTIVEAMCLRQLLLRKRLTVAHFTRHWQHLMLQCCGSRIAAVHQYVTIRTGMYVIFNSYKKYTITTQLSSDRLS